MVKLSSTCMLIRVRLENDTFSGVMFVLPFCRRTTTPVSINTTNMEPENHTVGKKNHHRNLHYWIPYRISGVYDICYVCVCIYTHISNKEERSHADFCGISIGWWLGVDSHFGGWYLLSFQISKNIPYRCFFVTPRYLGIMIFVGGGWKKRCSVKGKHVYIYMRKRYVWDILWTNHSHVTKPTALLFRPGIHLHVSSILGELWVMSRSWGIIHQKMV